jgi:hypothetical protein
MPRKEFARQIGKCERTVKRLVNAGKVVEREFGNERLIDIEATTARMRGEDRHDRKRRVA